MAVKLYQGHTLTDATVAMIKAIDNSDLSFMHVIVVPDRFSLQCEKLILKLLKQKALFNVRVVNLTKFSVELLSSLGVCLKQGEVLSSGENLLLTLKAIENVSEDFKTFKKGGIDFCYEISKTIAQIKSSGLSGDDLKADKNENSKNKFHDLSLIYKEYEKLLGDKLDANGRLGLLSDKLKGSNVLANTKIYFAQFDAFTKVGYKLIKTFVECAKDVNISFTASASIGNDYIYEKDIFDKIKNLSKELGIMVDVEKNITKLSPQKEAIIKGLYSYQKVKCENKGFYNLYSCVSSGEEIEAVAKLIRYLVYKGEKYKDIQIAAGNLNKTQGQIENIFSQYDIPFYIDSSISADKSLIGNLLRAYFETVIMGYSYDKIIDLLNNPLANDDLNIIEKAQKLCIDGKFRYKKYLEKEFKNQQILSNIEKSKTSKEFGQVVNLIIESIREKHKQILLNLESSGHLKERNINLQIEEIVNESVELISREREGEISAGEYFKLLSLLLSFKQVSTVPTYVDGVFVGDATESYFGESKNLIIIDGESLPVVASDNGLLSDDELCQTLFSIEPTIRMLNRRKRFKLFSLLTQAENKLFIFTQKVDEDGKKKENPTYIKNLNEIFGQRELKADKIFFSRKSDDINIKMLSSPLKLKDKQSEYTRENKVEKLNSIVFKDNKARVTQIEQYFACPFKHFVTYGLKLKENEIQKFQPRDIGNICHKGSELFLKEIIKNKTKDYDKEKISVFVDKNFDKIIREENLTEKIEDSVEKPALIKFIKNQLVSLCQDIVKELKISSFTPTKLEYKFADFKIDDITLIGKADRIDEGGQYFRIIDYKTGQTGNVLKELKFGEKLQLFLYQKFAKTKFNKEMGGAFYFNAKFDYSKDEESEAILKGLAPNDNKLIPLFDEKIEEGEKSEIISIYKSKKDGTYKGSAVSKFDMQLLSDYAEKITKKAIEEIKEGFIQPKPHSESCRGCKYFSLCGYEKKRGERKLK